MMRVLCCLALAACASRYREAADREGEAILLEKTALVERFQEEATVDPRLAEGAARTPERPPVDVPEVLTLQDAVSISAQYNRDYLARREAFFLSALGLGLIRRDFLEPIFSGFLGGDATIDDGDVADAASLSLSATRFLPTGGRLTTTATGTLSHFEGDEGREQDALATGTVTLSQPLLRGAGRDIAYEPLTQAERNLLYEARSYELFRQDFAIDVIARYFALVSQKQRLANLRGSVSAQEFAYRQAIALFEMRRGTQIDVFRAEQAFLEAQNAVLDAEQAYDLALDRFKIFLGLPTDVQFEITDQFPEVIAFELDTEAAVDAALENRLDLATARDRLDDQERAVAVARNALLPGLDLDVTYSVGSEAAGSFRRMSFDDIASIALTLEIPFDRKGERNAYRAALIGLEQSRRALRQAEDSVILEVRNSLRSLRQGRMQIDVQRRNIETVRRRFRRATLMNAVGDSSNRDVIEAQAQLTQAQNELLDRYVAYEIDRLRLLRELGLLRVDAEGRILE